VSDIGKWNSIEAEIIAALAGLSGVNTILPSMSMDQLANADGVRKPCVGVIYLGTEYGQQYAVGQRKFYATSHWRIGVVLTNLRGSIAGRPAVYTILEEIRDKIHFKFTTQSPKEAYIFDSESVPEQSPDGLAVGFVDFKLGLILGT